MQKYTKPDEIPVHTAHAEDTDANVAPPAEADATPPPDVVRQERDELHDRWVRAKADFENYRRRTERERRDLSDAITADVVRDLLPVVDDLERALAADWSGDTAARRGVELIHRQVLDALRKRGVEPLDVVGKDFDPAWHEAVASDRADGYRDNEVTAELRRGYRIGQRLIRPAQVKVAQG